MEKITATYEVVTPMFLGGGESEASTLRASSIKAELVFWWRALRFGHLVAGSGDISAALHKLHEEETGLFGGPGGKGDARQSAILIKARWAGRGKPAVAKSDESIIRAFAGSMDRFHGTIYLGYGLMNYEGKIEQGKSCFSAPAEIEVNLGYRKLHPDQLVDLLRALKLMGMLGGLGARKRRGWGSLALKALRVDDANIETLPTDPLAWSEKLASLINCPNADAATFPLSAFGQGCRIERWRDGKADALSAMEMLGAGYQQYRGWGRKDSQGIHRLTTKQRADQLFKADHDWFKMPTSSLTNKDSIARNLNLSPNAMPERANMGLPLQFQGKVKDARSIELSKTLLIEGPGSISRRASPLLFHIAKIGDKFYPVATWFNSEFLPGRSRILVKEKWDKGDFAEIGTTDFQPDPNVITNFLDARQFHKKTERYFDGVSVNLTGEDAS